MLEAQMSWFFKIARAGDQMLEKIVHDLGMGRRLIHYLLLEKLSRSQNLECLTLKDKFKFYSQFLYGILLLLVERASATRSNKTKYEYAELTDSIRCLTLTS